MKTGGSALVIAAAVLAVGCAVAGGLVLRPKAGKAATVDFNRDIRPILNSQCIGCHGGVKQAGGVSFSYREQALGKGKSGRPTVVPGSPRQSELMARITTGNPETRMPLHAAPLKAEQVALLRQWIEEGAPWQDYWAFVAPVPQPVPAVKQAGWARGPVDRFVLARLEQEKLRPSPEADKSALLRRVSLDLTGLPPTPEEREAFLADATPDAYEKQVDRLLASPRYGERWASLWLDLARYGDTKGFEKDRARPGAWTYRDWVIAALNRNMPYDQFVTRQVAGDLMPGARFSDRIATAFHRMTPANDEGGTDNEEFRLAAVMDRAATTWSVLNGVSFNCVQCHAHPYDPIRHGEYYKFLAFFNTTRDADIAFDRTLDEDWPVLSVPTDTSRYGEADRLQRGIAELRARLVAGSRATAGATRDWTLLPVTGGTVSEALGLEHAIAELKLRPASAGRDRQVGELQKRLGPARKQPPVAGFRLKDGMAEKTGTVPMNSAYDLALRAAVPRLTAIRIEVPPADPAKAIHSPEKGFVTSHIQAWLVLADGTEQPIPLRALAPDAVETLYGNMARMVRNLPGGGAPDQAMTRYVAHGGFMANPSLFRTRSVVAVPETPLEIPKGATLKLRLIQTEPINAESSPPPRLRVLASNEARWTAYAPGRDMARLEELERALRAIPGVPLPVMVEQSVHERRPTLQFDRGSFLTQVGPPLPADVPSVFPRLPADAPRNRLTLAKWFFSPGQPLTARVAVNRAWEQLFGTGLVETMEDFGSAGERPSHPELLDWLSLHFQNDLHWNSKALLRELVTSAAYRQQAATTPALLEKDPRNRLLARGPQQRLTAEMVRDQALQAAGLLNPSMGGPPVMPPQPEGVWNVDANNPARWVNATGPDRYRRAIYTYIKRTAIYPSFVTFDAADRQLSVPRRLPTNTPLQALVTLNDPVYHEATQVLAQRMTRASPVLDGRLQDGAQRVLSRDLAPAELDVLRRLHATSGMTAVASALLNLDAALTR